MRRRGFPLNACTLMFQIPVDASVVTTLLSAVYAVAFSSASVVSAVPFVPSDVSPSEQSCNHRREYSTLSAEHF